MLSSLLSLLPIFFIIMVELTFVFLHTHTQESKDVRDWIMDNILSMVGDARICHMFLSYACLMVTLTFSFYVIATSNPF